MALIQHDGLVCASDGDGVESLSVLTEDADGALRLLGHRGAVRAELPPRLRLAALMPHRLEAA
ncbi:hypothetical protein [Rhodanobacter lindaniclasticus]|uniref:Uncharacterized protein n=1 Tax=Rhodanobacter lindaniclasticus TaxID=75310 RepID=A0A4S3KG85_9GAMM|nr:hypothetical protein [Rhodanobacter lindaniclasticus]THD07596.1 hypothetical protein B1991_08105 [Rhodanobacter lindaniclasticus]